jgi:hypothetical protein
VAAEPVPVRTLATNRSALAWYRRAQRLDQWPGEAYDGTSVLAGCLDGRKRGLYDGFTWARRAEQLAAGIVNDGPAIVGVEWTDGSYTTDHRGVLTPGGAVVGGHCVCLIGFVGAKDDRDGELAQQLANLGLLDGVLSVMDTAHGAGEAGAFIGINSWGPSFGKQGLFVVALSTVRGWVASGGEFAQPVGRRQPGAKGAAAMAEQRDDQPAEGQGSGDTTLHITAVDVQEGDRILDPPDQLGQESVTVLRVPQLVNSWNGRRVVIDSTAGVFQLGAADPVAVRRSS